MKWFALLAILSSPAVADERIGAFVLPDDEPGVIMLDGDITVTAPWEFLQAASKRPDANTLVLNSLGGSSMDGLAIAEEVRDMGWSTEVRDGDVCHSACSFIFFGGAHRSAQGDVGVHQPDPTGLDIKFVTWAMARIVAVLFEFGVSAEILDAMSATPPSQIHILSERQLRQVGAAD